MMHKGWIGGLAGLSMLTMASAANALVYHESGASELPGTAEFVADGTTQISGYGGVGDVDMFGFYWGGGALSIDTFGSNSLSGIDTILYLFDAGGHGIAGNDDTANRDSRLSFASLTGGQYFVAIAQYANQPLASSGAIFPFVSGGGQYSPINSDPITGWTLPSGTAGPDAYLVNFSEAVDAHAPPPPQRDPSQVPEPASLALFGFGLAGLGLLRRKRAA